MSDDQTLEAQDASPAKRAKAPAKPKTLKVQAPEVHEDHETAEGGEGAGAAPAATAPAPRTWSGPEPTTMEELLAGAGTPIKNLKSGDVLDGTVVRVDRDEVLVDIGAKSEGVVSNRELHGRNGEEGPTLSVGDTVLVYVLQPESEDGHVVLSIRRAGLERKWRTMQEQLDAGTIIEAPVIDHNKGGLIVDIGLRGFLPASLVELRRVRDLSPYIGQKITAKILELDRNRNNVVLSRRTLLEQNQRGARDEFLTQLKVGEVRNSSRAPR